MRQIIHWNADWNFFKEGSADVTQVTLPHTWNAEDGQDGGNDYWRGTGIYRKEFARPAGDRIFLEVNGAAQSASVILNGTEIASHEGGYSTFRAELTDLLQDANVLEIRVNNAENDRIYPQKADFTFYGGLYRDVNLIAVPEEHFELVKDGTPGIKVTPVVDLSAKTAEVTVETWQNAETVTITVAGETREVKAEDGHAAVTFTVTDVRLWDGVDDPYLYTAEAELASGDKVSTRFGCRTFDFDPEQGFFLNGRSYPLRGVSRHQDRKGVGNALTMKEHREDLELIREIGANTIRLAHYQHAQEFYELCDEYGMVVWAEIPYITMHMANGTENTLTQMRELITQNYNHPSIAVWGLSNEITAASAVNEELLENHRQLNDLCHRIDPTRKTTMANVFMLETDSPILTIPDINSYNLYYGWYVGELEQTDEFFDEYHAAYPDRVIGFSEYGADANPAFQAERPEKGDYTEGYQAIYHEHMLQMIEERPYLWATHVWNMFDFAADGRDEGGKHGENQKGLVTFDRKIKKDAFYAYKAAWNKTEPFVHICGRRYMNRESEVTEVKVYSNLPEVTLFVDGKEHETKAGKRVFRFSVTLTGEHEITARAAVPEEMGGGTVSDTIRVNKVDSPDLSYTMSGAAPVQNWFDSDEIDPTCFSVMDKLSELQAHPQAGAVVGQMMAKASASRGDVADAVKDNANLQKMLGRMTLISLLKQAGADEEQVKGLNRVLQGIKK